MQVRLIMSWDIKPERDQEYFEFVMRDFVPGITRLGMQPTEAWFTVYGRNSQTPQIMMGAIIDSFPKLKALLTNKEWLELHGKLEQFITNYKQKIIRVTPYFPV